MNLLNFYQINSWIVDTGLVVCAGLIILFLVWQDKN